jgi:hypothetical protein
MHQAGGQDQISVAGLGGQLAEAQRQPLVIIAKPDAYTVLSTDCRKILTNEGATAQAEWALDADLAVGTTFSFIVNDGDGLKVTAPAGETLRVGARQTAAGFIDALSIGAQLTLTKVTATEWWARPGWVGVWWLDGFRPAVGQRWPGQVIYLADDFNGGYLGSLVGWAWGSSGTGAGFTSGSWTGLGGARQGQAQMYTGTTATGRAYAYSSWHIPLGVGRFYERYDVYLPAIRTAAEDFFVQLGFGDQFGGAEHSNGFYFLGPSDASGLGANWLACTANGGARTRTDTGVAMAAATWTVLEMLVETTQARFAVNGGTPVTNTTNLYSGAIRAFPQIVGVATAGFSRYLQIDYWELVVDLATTK